MKDPYKTKCGHSFEGKCIKDWISRGNEKCPICSQKIGLEDIVPNFELKGIIMAALEE